MDGFIFFYFFWVEVYCQLEYSISDIDTSNVIKSKNLGPLPA